jgi:Kef-type K+ transport system membrane component KefB
MKERTSSILDAAIAIIIFGVLPLVLYRYAESKFGIALGQFGLTALLLSLPIASFILLKARFEKGSGRRLVLSVAQIACVAVWLFVAVAPTISFKYGRYDVSITVISYLFLMATLYCLNIFHAYAEYKVHRGSARSRQMDA